MNKEKRNIFLSVLFFVQIGIVHLLSNFPTAIERFYSNGIYIYLSYILRSLFGWIPFSVGDLLYLFLIVLIIRFVIRLFKNRNRNVKAILLQGLASFSIFYFCFYFFWALNYSRPPITKYLQLETKNISSKSGNYDIEKLKDITDKLLIQITGIQDKLVINDTIPVIIPYSTKEIINLTSNGYQKLSKIFNQYNYEPYSLKVSLFSLPISYMGFAGYLNPLTGEAQVDYLIPKISLPMTCSHEIAHQLGIASENEANFIGFLAANLNDDDYIRYSAILGTLKYVLYDIHRYDKKLYKQYISKIPKGIIKNMRESQEFWEKYKNPAEPIFKAFYDSYLKLNQQKDGLKSYNKMVELLIAYDEKYNI